MENEVYITGGLRSFIGLKDKSYKNIPAEELGAAVLKSLNEKYLKSGVNPELVIAGNCVACNGNIARLALLKAGMTSKISGITIDAQCASGLESIITGFARIKSALNSVVVAGGTESASTQAQRSWNKNHPNYDSNKDNSYKSAQFVPNFINDDSMIYGADETCFVNNISIKEMIPFVLESHRRAAEAASRGLLDKITLKVFDLEKDESIRPSINENIIQRLPPLRNGGIINAATSCLMHDGAAFVTLCTKENAEKLKANDDSFFRIVDAVTVGADGKRSPEGFILAIDTILNKTGLSEKDIDRIDYNEAFACIDVLYSHKYSKPSNCFGGALAYGHPFGATGAMLLLHLMTAMELNQEKLGIVAVPAAGGIASAILVERIK